MVKIWFIIASPKSNVSEWEDIKGRTWPKYKGHTAWGIPDKNEDINKVEQEDEDIILCYDAAPKTAIVGECKCKGHYHDNKSEPGFENGIWIYDFKKYAYPIKFSELRKEGFSFIEEFLGNNNGRKRSIVEVSENDWDNFNKIYSKRKFIKSY
jgi:hypothetical protein